MTDTDRRVQELIQGIISKHDLEFKKPGKLRSNEVYWRDLQPWLAKSGYMLRPRYRPDWAPSWKGTTRNWRDLEDEQEARRGDLLDATRTSDGALVMLKTVNVALHPFEAEIGRYFCTGDLANEPLNHCCPIYDVLHPEAHPEEVIIVMPFLRRHDDPPMETVGEAVEFFKQVFEGLLFMHKNYTAHRDCNGTNLMMDATNMYPESFHPVRTDKARNYRGRARSFTRSQRLPKYLLVDFGISRQYKADQLPVREPIIQGGDKSPPEHQGQQAECDPFPTDVYYMGNMILVDFMQKFKGLEFMDPLVVSMVHTDPEQRPTMESVTAKFFEIRKQLRRPQLNARLADKDETPLTAFFKDSSSTLRGIARRASSFF